MECAETTKSQHVDASDRHLFPANRPIVTRRYFPRLSAGTSDKPTVDELVRCISDKPLVLLITNIWIGEGELAFPSTFG